MRKALLGVLALVGVLAGDCSSADGPPDRGEGYQYNYVNPPAAPRLDSLVASDARLTAYFTPSGGDHFQSNCYLASNGAYARSGFTFKSPAVVDSVQNGIEYSCAVFAFNDSRPSPASAYLKATPKAP